VPRTEHRAKLPEFGLFAVGFGERLHQKPGLRFGLLAVGALGAHPFHERLQKGRQKNAEVSGFPLGDAKHAGNHGFDDSVKALRGEKIKRKEQRSKVEET